jgi:uncharacterized membrane protein
MGECTESEMIALLTATTIIFALIALALFLRMTALERLNRELQVQVDVAETDLAIAYRKVEQEEEWPEVIGV